MNTKPLEELLERFRTVPLPGDVELVVAIANGGVIPAAIINQRLGKELRLLHLNLRDEQQRPRHDAPVLLYPLDFEVKGRRVLLVDDRARTGATLAAARELLRDAASVTTLVVNGRADRALYDEPCFRFPWELPVT
jgi:xanthine phosphoribosyltransferase